MAEVTQRSFDLKSWQGLTEVLRVARDSNLSPTEYAEFRNLVLGYAQQKGTDSKLKAKIDAMIASFGSKQSSQTGEASDGGARGALHSQERSGRRVVPTFAPSRPREPQPAPIPPPQPVGVAQEVVRAQPVVPAPEPTPPPPPPSPPTPGEVMRAPQAPAPDTADSVEALAHAPQKSVEEHRARIMEIKRRVNSLVENPVSLVDHGNPLGREYMMALLSALKATNPGATHNLEGAMEVLEDVFSRVLEYVSKPHENEESQPVPSPTTPEPVPESVSKHVEPEQEEPAPHPIEERSQEPVSENHAALFERADALLKKSDEQKPTPEEPPSRPQTVDEARWSEAGGDASVEEQIRELRKQLSATDTTPKGVRIGRRSLIPSLVDIEEDEAPEAKVVGTSWDPYGKKHDDLSPTALTQRPMSSLTGITLGTPQTELVAPEVTMALTELLHEWKIFSSSGLFGLGPGGIEHPLYIKLSRLPMGEVLSGRFDDADMKTVRSIKDYVGAWRHEQGVSYNPTETFEHYLRRVAQRIMKRERGIIDS